jgi:hypothetical protein
MWIYRVIRAWRAKRREQRLIKKIAQFRDWDEFGSEAGGWR